MKQEVKQKLGAFAVLGYLALMAMLMLGCLAVPMHAQTSNTFNVYQFKAAAADGTVGTMATLAQNACNPTLNCILIFDPILSGFPQGVMPTRCASCTWLDYRAGFNAPVLESVRYATASTFAASVADACNGSTPGRVVLPLGTVSCSSTVLVPSYCTIEGHGEGLSTLQHPAGSATAFACLKNSDQVNGNTNIVLRDFTLDGNKAAQTNTQQTPINFSKVKNSLLQNVECMNSTGNAASCIQWSTPGDNSLNINNAFVNVYAHDNGLSAINNADGVAYGGQNTRFIGLTSNNNTDTGLGLQGNNTKAILVESLTALANGGGGGLAAGPGTLGSSNSEIHVINPHIASGNSWGVLFQNVKGFEIKGGSITNQTGGASPPGTVEIDNSQDGLIDTRVTNCAVTCLVVNADSTNTTSNITVHGEYTNAQQNGVRVVSAAAGATVKDVSINAIVKNNSQASANTYDGVVVAATGTVAGIDINGGIYSDDQGSHTQRYGINYGAGTATAGMLCGFTATGNVTANVANIPGGNFSCPLLFGSITTTAAASDTLSISGMTASGHCSVQATNATAAGLTGVYCTAGTGLITVFHSSTASATFNVFGTFN